MEKNKKIFVLTADVGYGVLDGVATKFPDRFLNCGVSENVMVGAAVGLAIEGFIPVCYSLTPFLMFRPFEFLHTIVDYDKANVKFIGSGRGEDYADHNFTHLNPGLESVLNALPNTKAFYPHDENDAPIVLEHAINLKGPAFVNIKRR